MSPVPSVNTRQVTPSELWRDARLADRKTFAVLVVLAVVATTVFAVWTGLSIGGYTLTVAFSDLSIGLVSGAAAISCALAARASRGSARAAWGLLAASAASWTAGEIIYSVYEVWLGLEVPSPGASDAAYLLSIPLAIAGVFAFRFAPSRFTNWGSSLLAGAIVALSLLFVGWAMGLAAVYSTSSTSLGAQLIGIAYPVGDIVIITVLVTVLRTAPRSKIGMMLLLIGGLAANAFADSMFAYVTANGTYGEVSKLLDGGWLIGYLMIALAPWWPSRFVELPAAERPIELWQIALPWIAVLPAAATAIGLAANGQSLDGFLTLLAGAIGVMLVCNQIFSHRDLLHLLGVSHQAEGALRDRTAILNEVLGRLRGEVAGSATTLAIAAQELASATSDQTAAATETSVSMALLNKSATSIADTNDRVALKADQTRESLEMAQIDLRASGDRTIALAARVTEVERILEVIDEIADQTNLLALNAAIEAARAGDAGRGFAVVADEVRRLAERSKASAAQIKKLVQGAQAQSTSTVLALEKGVMEMERGLVMMKEMALLSSEVQVSTQQQRSATSQITEAIEHIAIGSHSVAATAQDMATAAERQGRLTADLARFDPPAAKPLIRRLTGTQAHQLE